MFPGALASPGRPLNARERQLLHDVFRESVNLDVVRIAYTDLGVQGRPYTLANVIRIPRGGDPFSDRTLVHEVTHVWQYQTRGTGYIPDSLLHQAVHGSEAYSVTLASGRSFYDYAAEQQAVIVEQFFANDPAGWSTEPDVVRMIEQVRRARPLSSEEIQRETWMGVSGSRHTAPSPLQDFDRQPQTVPIFRIEF
jgi:hypothetical protein